LQQFLSGLYNYFDNSTKLFTDLYPTKFLDTSAKSFFSRTSFTSRAAFGYYTMDIHLSYNTDFSVIRI